MRANQKLWENVTHAKSVCRAARLAGALYEEILKEESRKIGKGKIMKDVDLHF